MSEFNFKVGDKVILKGWNGQGWLKILHIGQKKFFAIDEEYGEDSWGFDNGLWLPYEEPKPELNFAEPWFWTKQKSDGAVYYFEKASNITFMRIWAVEGVLCCSGPHLKPWIDMFYEPSDPAVWANLIENKDPDFEVAEE